jgi:hypothetical protein
LTFEDKADCLPLAAADLFATRFMDPTVAVDDTARD